MSQHKTATRQAPDGTWVATCSCAWADLYPWATQSDAEAVTGEHLAGAGVVFVADEMRKES